MTRIALDELTTLAQSALERAGASPSAALITARALVDADARGLDSHGVSRVPQYAGHLRNKRVDGPAVPSVVRRRGGAMLVDAADGLAFPACALAVSEAIGAAKENGIAIAGVANSHHCGALSYHLGPVAEAGMVGLAFTNSPAAMPAWQGKRAIFGTNPIAAIFPRRGMSPIVVDLSLSEVARGKVMVAAREGKPIPLGWAVDKDGQPTTDAKRALEGMMLPAGGVKGAMLAMIVELLCAALTGSHMGFEADSFFTAEGKPSRIGQAFIVIDPSAMLDSAVYHERVETLLATMLLDAEVRIPGSRRDTLATRANSEGVEIPDALLVQLRNL
jgi:(2R)-3-sulfolactate dehydrogenase (NADP+)